MPRSPMRSPLRSSTITRRGLLGGAVALALVACGSKPEPASTTTATSGAFPATVTHKFGTVTVPSRPERIVVVGLTEQDTVLQLGYRPIATTEWYGEQPGAVWPWASSLLGDAKPTVLTTADGFAFEKIAALTPDLIIGVNAGIKKADYDKLSALAPTIAPAVGALDYFSPWDGQVELIAAALGMPEQGRKLIADVKDAYAKAAAANPDFKGKTASFSQGSPYEGELYVYPDGLNTEFLTYLGFTITDGLEKFAADAGSQAQISAENLDRIDADLIVFATEKAADIKSLEAMKTFETLAAVKGKRAVFTNATLSGAIYFMTPLALTYVVDHLTPHLARAIDGQSPRSIV
jgi:iron complex transport system substrate-binding protein